MGIYSTKSISRQRAISEITARLNIYQMTNAELEELLFDLTRKSGDPLYFNNFQVSDFSDVYSEDDDYDE